VTVGFISAWSVDMIMLKSHPIFCILLIDMKLCVSDISIGTADLDLEIQFGS